MTTNKKAKVGQFLRMLNKQKTLKITNQSLMESSTSVYLIIKQMYNFYKKENQSKIMQNKIYDIKIHDYSDTNKKLLTDVKIDSLFTYITDQNNSQTSIINSLIKIKNYLPQQLQKQIILSFCEQTQKISNMQSVLTLYSKILKDKLCISDKLGLYKKVQHSMIQKLTQSVQLINIVPMQAVCKFFYKIPVINIEILELIIMIFVRVSSQQGLESLKNIFMNYYNHLKQKLDKQKYRVLVCCLMKMPIKQNIDTIKQKLNQITKQQNKQFTTTTSKNHTAFLSDLYKQTLSKIQNYILTKQQQYTQALSSRDQNIIQFILQVLQNSIFFYKIKNDKKQSIDGQNYFDEIWIVFIRWFQVQGMRVVVRSYVSQRMHGILGKIFVNTQCATRIIQLMLLIQGGYGQNKQGYQISYASQRQLSASNLLITQILSNSHPFKKYINSKNGKLIVALGLLYDTTYIYDSIIFNQKNTDFGDLLLLIFQFSNYFEFFKSLFVNQTRRIMFQKYLLAVLQSKPRLYKDLFIKIDSTDGAKIFQLQDHYLLKFFWQVTNIQIAKSYIRDMATYTPSPYTIQTIDAFIKKFVGKAEEKIVYQQAVRTLHVILSTRQVNQLSIQFKKHLKQIIQTKIINGSQVFKNIPEKTVKDLSVFYASTA